MRRHDGGACFLIPEPGSAGLPRNLRLFLALWPDPAVARKVAGHARHWSFPPGCRRYGPQDWHVTLHFLGSVATERLPDLVEAIDLPLESCDLLLDRPQLWPRGLAVLCAMQVPPALLDLHRRLADALAGLDLPVEQRTYRPHVTLARNAGDATTPVDGPVVAWPVRDFALVVSTGRPDRRYEVIGRYPTT